MPIKDRLNGADKSETSCFDSETDGLPLSRPIFRLSTGGTVCIVFPNDAVARISANDFLPKDGNWGSASAITGDFWAGPTLEHKAKQLKCKEEVC